MPALFCLSVFAAHFFCQTLWIENTSKGLSHRVKLGTVATDLLAVPSCHASIKLAIFSSGLSMQKYKSSVLEIQAIKKDIQCNWAVGVFQSSLSLGSGK